MTLTKSVLFTLLILAVSFPIKAQQTIPKDTRIVLERFACYGTCPTYKLTIIGDGTVTFEPKDYYDDLEDKSFMTGKPAAGKISREQMLELISEFEKIKFFSLKRTYGKSWKLKKSETCPEIATDNPSAEVSYRINGKSKKIWRYYGCRGSDFLEKLNDFIYKIDEIVNSKQWIELNKYPKDT